MFYIFLVQMQRACPYSICVFVRYRLMIFQEFSFLKTRTECTLENAWHVLGRNSKGVSTAAWALISSVGIQTNDRSRSSTPRWVSVHRTSVLRTYQTFRNEILQVTEYEYFMWVLSKIICYNKSLNLSHVKQYTFMYITLYCIHVIIRRLRHKQSHLQ
jgi:hypothetical protein